MGEMELFFKCNKENRENREMPVCSTLKDENGNVTSTTTVVNETFTGGDAANAGTYSVTIENRKGFTLPKTGDIGTAMFLIIGIGGMLAAVYIMLRGRKRA